MKIFLVKKKFDPPLIRSVGSALPDGTDRTPVPESSKLSLESTSESNIYN
jgi:hypothetical protein